MLTVYSNQGPTGGRSTGAFTRQNRKWTVPALARWTRTRRQRGIVCCHFQHSGLAKRGNGRTTASTAAAAAAPTPTPTPAPAGAATDIRRFCSRVEYQSAWRHLSVASARFDHDPADPCRASHRSCRSTYCSSTYYLYSGSQSACRSGRKLRAGKTR